MQNLQETQETLETVLIDIFDNVIPLPIYYSDSVNSHNLPLALFDFNHVITSYTIFGDRNLFDESRRVTNEAKISFGISMFMKATSCIASINGWMEDCFTNSQIYEDVKQQTSTFLESLHSENIEYFTTDIFWGDFDSEMAKRFSQHCLGLIIENPSFFMSMSVITFHAIESGKSTFVIGNNNVRTRDYIRAANNLCVFNEFQMGYSKKENELSMMFAMFHLVKKPQKEEEQVRNMFSPIKIANAVLSPGGATAYSKEILIEHKKGFGKKIKEWLKTTPKDSLIEAKSSYDSTVIEDFYEVSGICDLNPTNFPVLQKAQTSMMKVPRTVINFKKDSNEFYKYKSEITISRSLNESLREISKIALIKKFFLVMITWDGKTWKAVYFHCNDERPVNDIYIVTVKENVFSSWRFEDREDAAGFVLEI